jgi:hypothetical protein
MVDDLERDTQLGPSLEEAGFVKEKVDVFLVLSGPLTPGVRLEELVIEESTRANVGDAASLPGYLLQPTKCNCSSLHEMTSNPTSAIA